MLKRWKRKQRVAQELEVVKAEFDQDFYLAENEDVREAKLDPFQHYMEHGWKEGRNPTPWFDTQFYNTVNGDVRETGMNPFLHYVLYGKAENRLPKPEQVELAPAPTPEEPEPAPEPEAVEEPEIPRSPDYQAFDAEYYLATYRDIRLAKIDPYEHYSNTGWREGRNPTDWFETNYYLNANPDVKKSGMNPFLHYVQSGKTEGRSPARTNHHYMQVLDKQALVKDHYKTYPSEKHLRRSSASNIAETIFSALTKNQIILSMSHDNYTKSVGGVQSCVSDEQLGMNELGYDYIHLFPANPKPTLFKESIEQQFVSVNVNGEFLGTYPCIPFARAFGAEFRPEGQDITISAMVIHHILGFSVPFVDELLANLQPQRNFYWLHDYFTICPQYTLMRNDVLFCGGPGDISNACLICNYGEERALVRPQMQELFEKHDFEVVSPSQYALDLWKDRAQMRHVGDHVSHHCSLEAENEALTRSGIKAGQPIRVGFLGIDFINKGWIEWKKLTEAYANDNQFEFYHFGYRNSYSGFDNFVPVSVTADNRMAMFDAIREHEIDVVFLWAIWPETFSFTLHEAMAAGCYIVTNINSGNVQAQIKAGNAAGKVYDSYEDFLEDIEEGHLFEDLMKYRAATPPVQSTTFTPFLPMLFDEGVEEHVEY